MPTIQNNTTAANGAISSTAANANNSAAALAAAEGSGKQIQDQFMKMLVAQMKYQDPTNPMSSSDMTSQMAQISTVDGISKLNTSMTSLLAQMQSSQAFEATNLVGKSVLVPGNALNLVKGQAAFGAQLDAPAASLKVNILNSMGQPVDVLTLGPQPAGTVPLVWDGKDANGKQLPDGPYQFQLAANIGGKNVNPTGLTVAGVTGILNPNSSTGTQIMLDNNTTTSFSNVAQIR
jgi:flagellar basal-body rod modification protein FlgD|uniref:flagellar hook assembly protein FlgD n=1 Tax=Polynucleobacter sp. TaxID=2029855 RepID=UPI0040473626